MPRFKNASKAVPHVVLTDLDNSECAPSLLSSWGVYPLHEKIIVRVAEREVESWLLADRDGIASLLGVDAKKVPSTPDKLIDPKRDLINLARRSKSRRFASEFVPANGSAAQIGVLYNDHLCSFIRGAWDVESARQNSPSLNRSVERIKEFAKAVTT